MADDLKKMDPFWAQAELDDDGWSFDLGPGSRRPMSGRCEKGDEYCEERERPEVCILKVSKWINPCFICTIFSILIRLHQENKYKSITFTTQCVLNIHI